MPENTVLVSIKMLSNKVRNDSFWLLKCYEYLAAGNGNLNTVNSWAENSPSEIARSNALDFRETLKERLASYVTEIEALEAKLEKEKARVSLEITEKAVPAGPPQVIQHTNQFVEVLAPPAAAPKPALPPAVSPTRVAVVKEEPQRSPVKVALPPAKAEPEPEPEEEEEEEEEEEAEPEPEEEAEEEEEEEEEEDEPEPEENYEQIRIKKKNYWLETNSRKVYEITAEGEVGDLVAKHVLVNGVATLAPL
jgi:hypothetical protein